MGNGKASRASRPGIAAATGPALAAMARRPELLAAFLVLALLATATRMLPALAIGLVVDRVGANRAHATLAAIVIGLCLLALAELALAEARDAAGALLRARGAGGMDGAAADRRTGAAATLDLVEAASCVPLLALLVVGGLCLADGRIGAVAACLVLVHAGTTAILAALRREAAWRLHGAARGSAEAMDASFALEQGRAQARRALGFVARLGYACALGACALEVMSGALTPGGLIVALLLLRQLQSAGEGASGAWLRAIELVPRLAAPGAGAAP